MDNFLKRGPSTIPVLLLALVVVLWGVGAGRTLLSILPAPAQAQESEEGEREEESGPSLEELREMRQQFEGGSGGETISPSTPSAGETSGSMIEELRGKLPQFEPTGREKVEEASPYSGESGSISGTTSGGEGRVFLQVQAPPELVLGGTSPPSCSGSRSARNQAVICASGSTFDKNAQVQIKAVPVPNLREISHVPGNPARAIYLFTAPAPGTYKFTFEARVGNSVETASVEVQVRQKEAPPNNEPSLVLTRTGVLGVRAEAFDPDRGDRVCIRPANTGDLVNPRESCGVGRVGVDYAVSDSRVRNDPPRLIGFSKLIEPSCKRIKLTFLVTDAKGGRVSDSIDVEINGVWRAGFGGFGVPSRFQFERVIGCQR